jgi:hypothetical protein
LPQNFRIDNHFAYDYHKFVNDRRCKLRPGVSSMRLLPPAFNGAFSSLKLFQTASNRSKPGAELVALVGQLLEPWPFDESWYLATYDDVAKALRDGKIKSARLHYIEHGYFECRLPFRPELNEAWYLKRYPDLVEGIAKGKFKSALQHYIEFGYAEGRVPSEAAETSARSLARDEAAPVHRAPQLQPQQ